MTAGRVSEGSTDLRSVWAAGGLGRRTRGGPEVVFAQVREDVGVETALFARCAAPATAFCIAAGGCTAFSLLTAGAALVHAVDINPAQVHLVELKQAVLGSFSYAEVLRCLTGDPRARCPRARGRLAQQPSQSIGFFALSNVLEVMSDDYAERLAHTIRHSATPGALVCLRGIFPPDPETFRAFSEGFVSEPKLAAALSQTDRSPFCRFLRVLRVTV